MGNDLEKTFISQEDFLITERAAKEKHEYFKGEIFAMSGASRFHNRLSMNLSVALGNYLKGKKVRLTVVI